MSDQLIPERTSGISRRTLFGALGIGALTVAGAATGIAAAHGQSAAPSTTDVEYPFFGEHQQGITTPMQDSLVFASLDVTTSSREELVALFQAWTTSAAEMTAGKPIGMFGANGGSYDSPPQDTGEALDLAASGLTITFGFGPTLFQSAKGVDRFGFASQQPTTLHELPHFPGDVIDTAHSDGDLCIQACANDPQVAIHAVRNLIRQAFGTATVKWMQTGFGRSSSTGEDQPTPRNLFGFKDGTNNIMSNDTSAQEEYVWVQPSDQPAWMLNGTYLAVRKIRMLIETWDRTSLREQESVFGRTRPEGAPLSGGSEFTTPNFAIPGREGAPLIPVDSHMALANPANNNGVRILRRAYNYTNVGDDLGRFNAGLFFLGYERDIDKQFIPMQLKLSKNDRMNEYVRYIANATFAIPPGITGPGDYLGKTLIDATP